MDTIPGCSRISVIHIRLHGIGHVVAQSDIINRSFRQDFLILRKHVRLLPGPLPFPVDIARVMPPHVDIREQKTFMHSLLRAHDILRIAGVGIEGDKSQHTSDLHLRIDLMALFHNERGCDQLIVHRLIHGAFRIIGPGKAHAGIRPTEDIRVGIGLVVDLVEGHPPMDFILEPLHDGYGIADKTGNDLPTGPSAEMLRKIQRHLEMAERDHRLDTAF